MAHDIPVRREQPLDDLILWTRAVLHHLEDEKAARNKRDFVDEAIAELRRDLDD